MKAVEANFLKFLQQPKQFVIPIYQRMYSWELAQCQQLWRDILRVGKDTGATGHFIGSVVYIAKGIYVTSSVPQLLVIDGQQRLTTLSLLLAAFAHAIEKQSLDIGISRGKLMNYYLFNAEEEGDLHFKLILTRSDKTTLMRFVEGKDLPDPHSPRVAANYQFFVKQIAGLNPADLKALWAGIQKLIIVDIALDREHDNPQLIFESLNATALKLTESDLIRNYVLMDLPPQEQTILYDEYWEKIEKGFANSGWFDWFVRDFLTVKMGTIPNVRDVYVTFKTYVEDERKKHRAIDDVVKEMLRYSIYFVRIAEDDKEPDAELRAAFRDLRILEVSVARPYLMHLYWDYEHGKVDRKDMLSATRMIESYVFRRSICGVATNTLNSTFARLDGEIRKEHYLDSLLAALILKDSYRRFPGDEEFKTAIVVKDVYNYRPRNYLLAKLENHNRKEPIDVKEYTIEHILPQNPNLRPEWQSVLGSRWKEIHQQYLHTLGNLTLTGYNAEYGDRSFGEKRDMIGGFRESPLRLNHGLGQLETWNDTEIQARAHRLAEKALAIWTYPDVPAEALAAQRPPALADDEHGQELTAFATALQGNTLLIFQEFKKRTLNLDASVRLVPTGQHIGFEGDVAETFVSVIPYVGGFRLLLNIQLEELSDPEGVSIDISGTSHWGIGDVAIVITKMEQIDYVMSLVQQSFEKQIAVQPTDFIQV